MINDQEAWTVLLGKELQRLHAEGATDQDLHQIEAVLRLAIQQIKFIRKCYNKPAAHTEVSS